MKRNSRMVGWMSIGIIGIVLFQFIIWGFTSTSGAQQHPKMHNGFLIFWFLLIAVFGIVNFTTNRNNNTAGTVAGILMVILGIMGIIFGFVGISLTNNWTTGKYKAYYRMIYMIAPLAFAIGITITMSFKK